MSPELVAILAVGVGLAGLLITLMQQTRSELRGDLQQLRSEVRALETRVAAVEQGQARLEETPCCVVGRILMLPASSAPLLAAEP